MEMPRDLTLNLPDAGATEALGQWFAQVLRPGDTILLEGPVGAGKTHFARSVIQSRLAEAGLSEDVPSPTFTLVQTYDDDRATMVHADLYRLTSPDEVHELGLPDAFGRDICLVEWPDRLGPEAPADALTIRFRHSEDGASREVNLSDGNAWAARLDRLRADWHR